MHATCPSTKLQIGNACACYPGSWGSSCTSSQQGWSIGCFRDPLVRSAGLVFRGDVSPFAMTTAECTVACASGNYSIAGLLAGSLCYCISQSQLSSMQQASTVSECGALCAGDQTQYCGGQFAFSLFNTSVVVKSVALDSAVVPDLLSLSQPVTLAAVVDPPQSAVSYQWILNGPLDATSTDATPTFTFPFEGYFSLEVIVSSGINSVTGYFSLSVSDQPSAAISIPTVLKTNTSADMLITVAAGLNVNLSVTIDNGLSTQRSMNLSCVEALMVPVVHFPIPRNSPNELPSLSTSSFNVVALVDTPVLYGGLIKHVFFDTWSSTSITMVLLRPHCATGTTFCLATYSCVSSATYDVNACAAQSNILCWSPLSSYGQCGSSSLGAVDFQSYPLTSTSNPQVDVISYFTVSSTTIGMSVLRVIFTHSIHTF